MKDYVEAMRLFKHVHSQGAGYATRRVGEIYRDGEGVPKDVVKAVYWHRKAATDSKFG